MRNLVGNMNTFIGTYTVRLAIDQKCGDTRQNIENLLGLLVKMQLLGRMWRHSFLNHTQAIGLQQVPTVAIISPRIMFGVLDGKGRDCISH